MDTRDKGEPVNGILFFFFSWGNWVDSHVTYCEVKNTKATRRLRLDIDEIKESTKFKVQSHNVQMSCKQLNIQF